MAQNFLNHVCFCTQHWIFIFVLLHLFGLYSRRDLLTNSELPLLIKDHHLLLIYLHLADSSFNCLAVVLPLSASSEFKLPFNRYIFGKHYLLPNHLLCLIFYFPEFWLTQKLHHILLLIKWGDTVRSTLRHTRKRQKEKEMNDKQIMKAKNVWRTNDTEERQMKNMRK